MRYLRDELLLMISLQRVEQLESENKKLRFDVSRLKVDMMELAQVIVDLRNNNVEAGAGSGKQEHGVGSKSIGMLDQIPQEADRTIEQKKVLEPPETKQALRSDMDEAVELELALFPEEEPEKIADQFDEPEDIEDDEGDKWHGSPVL